MFSALALLFGLLYNPLQSMAGLRARSPYVSGALFALVAEFAYDFSFGGDLGILSAVQKGLPGRNSPLFIMVLVVRLIWIAAPVLFLGVIFIPACILAASLIDKRATFLTLLKGEYAPLASCILYSWAVVHLVMLIPIWVLLRGQVMLTAAVEVAIRLGVLPLFIFLVVIAFHVVLRLSYGRAIGTVALAALSLVALQLVPRLLFSFSSPFLIILLFLLLRNYLGGIVSAQQARERFKQNLEAATLNPADASAHYNLGLIYQQRGQFEEAKTCFLRAVEIDPGETDAHYQLGRIAREQGRLPDAIAHFDAVVRDNPEHSQHEIWREIGRAYFQAEQYADARGAFERFLEKRPTDAEGHYRYGLTLHRLGQSEEAAIEMRAVIEYVRTSPAFKYRAEKHWMNEAQSFLRSQSA
jgi:tetratricopeptide (TPR) repeat protein